MALTMSHVAGPATPAVREWTFGDLLRKAAESAPDRLALIAGLPDPALRRKWTYAELYREAQRTARALSTRFKKGERIAVWAQNLPEWIMLEFGAGMAGLVLVTVNPAFRANEVQYVLKQSRSSGVFVVNSFRGNPMLETIHAVKANCPPLRRRSVLARRAAASSRRGSSTPPPPQPTAHGRESVHGRSAVHCRRGIGVAVKRP